MVDQLRGVIGLRKLERDYPNYQQLIDNGMFGLLIGLLNSPWAAIREEAIWVLSLISSALNDATQKLYEKGIIPILISLYDNNNPELLLRLTSVTISNMVIDSIHFRN